MNIHYFQRYHTKENVATANTLLLLSRLYYYSPAKFYRFIQHKILDGNTNLELYFQSQYKSSDSVPDAVIIQPVFKILIETKVESNIDIEQLINYIKSFNENDNYKILITLNKEDKLKDINAQKLQNAVKDKNIITKHFSFSKIIECVRDILDEHDYEMIDILDDYSEYCTHDNLINDGWKKMKVRTTGATFNINMKLNVYYDDASNGYSAHDYLGLYKDKSIRAVGKIKTVIKAIYENNDVKILSDDKNIDSNMKDIIKKAIIDADNYGYDLRNTENNYFFVEKFIETDFKKLGKPLQGSKIFDLTSLIKNNGKEIINKKDMPNVEEIANQLRNKTWGQEQE